MRVKLMPIPKDILAVERPKNTVVKMRLGRYLVIKRTSKRVNGKAKPVDLGTIGEIIDGKYVEIRAVPKKRQKQIVESHAVPSGFSGAAPWIGRGDPAQHNIC